MSEIFLAIISFLCLIFFYQNIKLNKKYNELKSLPDKIDNDIHRENFIKFLSDSRDMAFIYINDAQKQIKEFIDIADKEFAFFDSFGSLTQEYPHYEEMKKISKEYKKLKSLLPEEPKTRND